MDNRQPITALAIDQKGIVEIKGEVYSLQGLMPGGHYHFMHAKTGQAYLVDDRDSGERRFPDAFDLERMLAAEEFIPISMRPSKNAAAGSQPDVDPETIDTMDPVARGRRLVTRLWDRTPCRLSDAAILCFLSEHKAEIREAGLLREPHPATVRRWLKYRGTNGDRSLSAMVSMSGRVPRLRSFPPSVEKKIDEQIEKYWLHRELRPCEVIDAVQAFVDDHNECIGKPIARTKGVGDDLDDESNSPLKLPRPSARTLSTRIRKSETGVLYKQKFGDKAFRTKYRTPHDRRLYATKILDTAIVDHTVVDTMLVIDSKHRAPLGRPTLALMVDVASRAILSYYVTFEKPSLHTATQLLKRAVRPKPHLRRRFPDAPDGASVYGLPKTIVHDRALETIGVSHRDGLSDLGVEVVYAGAGEPQAKGIIERIFRTLNDLLFHRLPGSVPLPASMMREMGYDPSETCVITLEDLTELIDEAINVYHYQLHRSIAMSPIHYWSQQRARVYTLPDPGVLDQMLGFTEMRTLDRAGIRLNHLEYCCEINVPLLLDANAAAGRTRRGARKGSVTHVSKIKFNPEDISRIWVLNEQNNLYYELRCTDPAYAEGTSLWMHREIRKWALANANQFRTPQQRRKARGDLARSIEAAFPDIGLKAKMARKRMCDAFPVEKPTDDAPPAQVREEDFDGSGDIHVEVAARTRADRGALLRSPQRGKTARKRNAGQKVKSSATRIARPSSTVNVLLTMQDGMREAAEAHWGSL